MVVSNRDLLFQGLFLGAKMLVSGRVTNTKLSGLGRCFSFSFCFFFSGSSLSAFSFRGCMSQCLFLALKRRKLLLFFFGGCLKIMVYSHSKCQKKKFFFKKNPNAFAPYLANHLKPKPSKMCFRNLGITPNCSGTFDIPNAKNAPFQAPAKRLLGCSRKLVNG